MKALVTGGSGFIGAALCAELVASGHQVVVLDDGSRGHSRRLEPIADDVELLTGNVCDLEAVRRAVQGCETVWHLAYINGTRYFYERPDDVLEVGIRGTLNTIQAALESGVRRYVLASTSETYQTPSRVPTDESEPLKIPDVTNPRYSYGGGKIAAELLTLHLGGHRGLQTVIFRPHNIYGPDMGHEHVIPEITRRIIQLTEGLKRNEIDLPIQGDGSETRSFCFVSDGAAAARVVGEKGDDGGIYHIGTDREISIYELTTMIGEILGVTVNVVPGALRAGGTPRRCPDIGKVRSLGYEPQVALEVGLADTVNWYANYYRLDSSIAGASRA